MLTIEKAEARVREAEKAYQEVYARLDANRAALAGEGTDADRPASIHDRLASMADAIDPDSRAKRLKAEMPILEGLQAEAWQSLMQARRDLDVVRVFELSAPYVEKLKALASAAEAVRAAHAEVEEEAARVIPLLGGGTALPQVWSGNVNIAALTIIADAERAIAICQSRHGIDERKDNPLADLLNPFAKLFLGAAERAGPYFDIAGAVKSFVARR